MRKYIIIFNLVYLVCSSFADAQTSVNLALRHKLSMKDSYADEMYILVQGDVKAIELFTKINNGHFINSAGDIASVKFTAQMLGCIIKDATCACHKLNNIIKRIVGDYFEEVYLLEWRAFIKRLRKSVNI